MSTISLETIPMDIFVYISTNYFDYSILYQLGLINKFFYSIISTNLELWKLFYNKKYNNTRTLENISIYRNALVKKIYKEYIIEYNLFNRTKQCSHLITLNSLISLVEKNHNNSRKYKYFLLLKNNSYKNIDILVDKYKNIDVFYQILLFISNKIKTKYEFLINRRNILLTYLETNKLYNHYCPNTHITYYLYNIFKKWWNTYSINSKFSLRELLIFNTDISVIDYGIDYKKYNYITIVDSIQLFYYYSNQEGLISKEQFIQYNLDHYHFPKKLEPKYLIKYMRRLLTLYKLLVSSFSDNFIFTRILI